MHQILRNINFTHDSKSGKVYQNSPLSIDHNPKTHTNNSLGTYYTINTSFKVSITILKNHLNSSIRTLFYDPNKFQ